MKYNKIPLPFKVSAIYLAEQRNGSLMETARDLGVSKPVLGCWFKTNVRLVGELHASSKDRKGAMGRKTDDEDLRKQNKAMRED